MSISYPRCNKGQKSAMKSKLWVGWGFHVGRTSGPRTIGLHLIANNLKCTWCVRSISLLLVPDFQTTGALLSSCDTFSSRLDSALEPNCTLETKIVTKNRLILTKKLTPDEKLLDYLTQAGVISIHVKEEIAKKRTRSGKTQVKMHFTV